MNWLWVLVVDAFAAGLLWCVLRCLGWGLLLRGGWFLQVGCSWWCLVLLLLNDVVGWGFGFWVDLLFFCCGLLCSGFLTMEFYGFAC